MSVNKVELKELKQELLSGENILSSNLGLIKDLEIKLNVALGNAEMTVEELMALQEGSVVSIDKKVNTPLDVYANGELVAKGHMVVVEDDFGIQITEIAQ